MLAADLFVRCSQSAVKILLQHIAAAADIMPLSPWRDGISG
jgi:hypothetical protein